MKEIFITAASVVTEADLKSARLGQRFGRLDLQSQLALLAVTELKVDFTAWPPGRVGICLSASAGSLSTDVNFWQGRNGAGGPSPTLFAYTLPSAAVGEIAIHFRLTGPDRCFVGGEQVLLPEGADLIRNGEVDACICVYCDVVSNECGGWIGEKPQATAGALFMTGGGPGRPWLEIDRDMKRLCTLISRVNSAG